jgi:hypothetical protein
MPHSSLSGLLVVMAILTICDCAVGQEFNTSNTAGSAIDTRRREASATFMGDKTAWYGFDRFDFLMDEAKLTVKPFRAALDEGTGVNLQVEGQIRCVVVVPSETASGNPWSWRGRYFDHEPQAEVELLRRGFHIAFVQSDDIKHWEAWFKFLTEQHGLSTKPAFVGMSGGGLVHLCRQSSDYTGKPDEAGGAGSTRCAAVAHLR